eukprot:1737358-Pyramimonas_sp.AAC.1
MCGTGQPPQAGKPPTGNGSGPPRWQRLEPSTQGRCRKDQRKRPRVQTVFWERLISGGLRARRLR